MQVPYFIEERKETHNGSLREVGEDNRRVDVGDRLCGDQGGDDCQRCYCLSRIHRVARFPSVPLSGSQ